MVLVLLPLVTAKHNLQFAVVCCGLLGAAVLHTLHELMGLYLHLLESNCCLLPWRVLRFVLLAASRLYFLALLASLCFWLVSTFRS